MKRTGPTNQVLQALITDLRRSSTLQKAPIWDRLASDLEKPARSRRVVNISRIARNTKPNETVVVPGKVLGSGVLTHSVTVAAFAFSKSARQQIEKAKGKAIAIAELLKTNPKGKDVRIIG